METRAIDGYTLEFVSPTLFRIVWAGEMTQRDVEAVRELSTTRRAARPGERQRVLVDTRGADGITHPAREELRKMARLKPWDYVAFVGASYRIEVAINLLLRAMRLMQVEVAEVRFFDALEEGMAWLEGVEHPSAVPVPRRVRRRSSGFVRS